MQNKNAGKASLPVIRRLPKYYRYLSQMRSNGITRVSSSELARIMGTTASQVRQDFNCFGGFGQQGIGYSVDTLLNEISILLFGVEGNRLPAVLIGCGHLGTAVSSFVMHDTNGYNLIGAFDKNTDLAGKTINGITIQPISELKEFCSEQHPVVAVVCVPREGAIELVPSLQDLGFRGFWNFSHFDFSVSFPDAVVENVHLGDSLMSLGYRIREKEEE